MYAGSPYAQAVVYAKQCPVQTALNHAAFPVEEIVLVPVERCAGMGAGIYVSVDAVSLSNQTEIAFIFLAHKFFAAAVFDVLQTA